MKDACSVPITALLCCLVGCNVGGSAIDAALQAQAGWAVPPLACPDDSKVYGRVNPNDVEQWCDKGGVMHGPYVKWHANHRKAAQGNYQLGDKHGPWVWWHDNGNYAVKGKFVEDKYDDTWTWYYPDGTVQNQGDFRGGRKVGEWHVYHPNGKLKSKGLYANNKKTGFWDYFDESGKRIREEEH